MAQSRNGRRTGNTTATAIVLDRTSPAGCIGAPAAAGFVTRTGSFGVIPRRADAFGVAPAGDLTSGVPTNSQAPGTFQFRTNIQVLGADPSVNAAAFLSTLQRTVQEIMGSSLRVNSASIVRGGRDTQEVPRSAFVRALPGIGAAATLLPKQVPTWWLTIQGNVTANNAWVLNGGAGFNRAIARAVAQTTRLTRVDDDYTVPPDGGPLDAMFRADGACSGHRDFSQVYAAACTRLAPGAAPAAPAPQQQMVPIPPPSPSVAPTPTGGPSCAIRVQSQFWLRPRATFDREGRNFPAGTAILVTGNKLEERGTLALYPVTVGAQSGYAALSAADFVGCTAFSAPPGSGSGGSSTSTLRPPAPIVAAPMLLPPQQQEEGTSAWVWGGAAAVASLAGIAAVVKRKEIKAWIDSKRKRNGARRRRRSH